jgi:hypothetical protein
MPVASVPSFAKPLAVQLIRGAVGFLAIAAAFKLMGGATPLSIAGAVALVAVALVAWRGCPTCWLIGLIGVFGSRSASCPIPRPKD